MRQISSYYIYEQIVDDVFEHYEANITYSDDIFFHMFFTVEHHILCHY